MKVAFIKRKVLTWLEKTNMKNACTLGSRVEGLYKVNGRPIKAMAQECNFNQIELWHHRFAHLHYKALRKVKKMVSGMPEIQSKHDGVFLGCESGKKTRGPFPSSSTKTHDILQLIHSDLSGPMLVTSIGGYLYYITFVDDFSRKTWIYFLKHKDEAFDMFKNFKALIENQTRKKIKFFRLDNGGEFIANEFIEFYREFNIKKESIVPYNPEHNGVAERKNINIMEVSCAMLHDHNVPMFPWGEASNTMVYVQNKTLHRALYDKTPEEVFTGKKPGVSHLRIFGCPVYFHVPKEKRNKIEA